MGADSSLKVTLEPLAQASSRIVAGYQEADLAPERWMKTRRGHRELFGPARVTRIRLGQTDVENPIGVFYDQEVLISTSGERCVRNASSYPRAFEAPSISLVQLNDETNFRQYRQETVDGIAAIAPSVVVLDLSSSILDRRYYPLLAQFHNLRDLSLPRTNLRLDDPALRLPDSLATLAIHNCALNNAGLEKIRNLPSLRRLSFSGCWLEDFITLPFESVRFPGYSSEDNLAEYGIRPYDGLSQSVTIMELVNCDPRLAFAMLYYQWSSLEHLSLSICSYEPRNFTAAWLAYLGRPLGAEKTVLFPKLESARFWISERDLDLALAALEKSASLTTRRISVDNQLASPKGAKGDEGVGTNGSGKSN